MSLCLLLFLSITSTLLSRLLDNNIELYPFFRSGGFGLLSQEALTMPFSVYLPIGTEVTFAHRKLPSTESQLCYQAFAVWLNKYNAYISGGIGSIFDEYYEIYSVGQIQQNIYHICSQGQNQNKLSNLNKAYFNIGNWQKFEVYIS